MIHNCYCYSEVCFIGDEDNLRTLKAHLYVNSDKQGILPFAYLLGQMGIETVEYNLQGSFIGISSDELDKDGVVRVKARTIRDPRIEVWDEIAKFFGLSYVYVAEAPYRDFYVNTDKENKYLKTRYALEYSYHDEEQTQEDFVQFDTDDVDILKKEIRTVGNITDDEGKNMEIKELERKANSYLRRFADYSTTEPYLAVHFYGFE